MPSEGKSIHQVYRKNCISVTPVVLENQSIRKIQILSNTLILALGQCFCMLHQNKSRADWPAYSIWLIYIGNIRESYKKTRIESIIVADSSSICPNVVCCLFFCCVLVRKCLLIACTCLSVKNFFFKMSM